MPHPNNKTKIQTQSSADSVTTSHSPVHQNKKEKNQAHLLKSHTLQEAYTTGPTLLGQKPKGRNNSVSKPGERDLKHNKLKKWKCREKNAWMKEWPGNTQVQINEEGIGKLPEKELGIMIGKDDPKPSKIEWRKCKNQLTHLTKTNKK